MEGALEFRIVFFTFISQAPNSNSGSSVAKHRAVVCLDLGTKSCLLEDSRVPPEKNGNHGLPGQFGATKSTCSVLSVSCGDLVELGELEERHKVVDLATCVLVHPDLSGWTFLSIRNTEGSVLTPPRRKDPRLLC